MPFVNTAGFSCDPPALRPDGPTHFVLVEDARYRGWKGDEWDIEAGFRTDGASIPTVLRWFIDRFGAHSAATLVHDKLCALDRKRKGPGRRHTDGIFRRILREEGVEWHVRWMMWAAVRVGCGFEGGMSRKEALQLAACMPAGLLIVVLSIGPVIGRCLSRLVGWAVPL